MANAAKGAVQAARNDVEPDEVGAEVLSKIAPRKVLEDNPKKFVPAEGKPAVDLFTVFGIANGTKTGNTQYGDWEALTGVFEAVRTSDGRRFQSGVCFMPGAAGQMLVGGLKAAQSADKDASVRFAIVVGIKRSEVPIGYEFTSRQVVKLEQADPLADLRAKALGYEGKK